VAAAFDRIADLYRGEFASELDRKPFDRDLLTRVGAQFEVGKPVLEVGAGPAHVAGYLAERGVRVVASDASLGQLHEAGAIFTGGDLVAADLARLPIRRATLGGIVAFYCLIYGPAEDLDAVFADWHAALAVGGLVVIAVHAGQGTVHSGAEWHGRPLDITVVLRDPNDLAARLRERGFVAENVTVRRPYDDEHQTERCYIVARRV